MLNLTPYPLPSHFETTQAQSELALRNKPYLIPVISHNFGYLEEFLTCSTMRDTFTPQELAAEYREC
jgi:hypothetical protein